MWMYRLPLVQKLYSIDYYIFYPLMIVMVHRDKFCHALSWTMFLYRYFKFDHVFILGYLSCLIFFFGNLLDTEKYVYS